MKQICLQCGRTSAGGDLFCQETYCPGEMSPTILDAGDWFGDIEIIKPVIVLRSCALYEASHQKRKVYLKVAHPGAENKERLKREAEFLQSLDARKQHQPTLPHLLPPYPGTTVAVDPYGKTMLRGHLLYFILFEYFEGEPLSDVLRRNPQLWIQHVGWIMLSLAVTINYLNAQGRYHFGLSPDSILVHFDEKPSVPRILLFDLGMASEKQHLALEFYPFAVPPAYMAPELVEAQPGQILPDYRTEVYGLGIVFYELLVGQPAFPFKLRSDNEVLQAVTHGKAVPMNRIEDVRSSAQIALQACNLDPTDRQKSAYELAQQLRSVFRDVPPPKRSARPSLNTLFLLVIALLIIVFLIVLVISLTAI